jgi:small subunit ribosomal protein S4
VKRIYGLLERQFRKCYTEAARRRGVTGEMLLRLLECRLDNTVYRLGLAASRQQARQLVTHSAIEVNQRKVNRPSCQVKPGDTISARADQAKNKYFSALGKRLSTKSVPSWLSLDVKKLAGKVISWPNRGDIDLSVDTQLIVELYSR